MKAETPTERYYEKLLFTDRNPNMVTAIEKLAADGKVHVVAVGCLHYFGPKGLLQLLKARGFETRPVRQE